MASLLQSARFATTAVKLAQLPRARVPEIAFVGRSNAGKSSAINALCQRRRLAFASKTPGRTQALNCFALGPERAPKPLALIVDTPGYGFAAAPLAVKRGWDQLAGRYLQVRAALCAVVLVLDVRRGLTALDRALLHWMQPQVPVLAILTKCDKLGRADQRKALDTVEAELRDAQLPNPLSLLAFSSTSGLGVEQARAWIEAIVAEAIASVAEGEPAPEHNDIATKTEPPNPYPVPTKTQAP